MVFCFPGSDQRDSFLHFQGDENLPGQQSYLGVYFPFFPYEDALIATETIVIPDQELNVMGVDPPWQPKPGSSRHGIANTGTSLGSLSGMSVSISCGGPLGIRKMTIT